MRKTHGMPIIFRGGSYFLDDSNGSIHLKQVDSSMHDKLPYLIDISNAEATVESDKTRIMKMIDEIVGIANLNTRLRGIILGASQSNGLSEVSRLVSCAACQDFEALSVILSDPLRYISYAASCGYTNVLAKILELGVDPDKSSGSTWNALHSAANGAHTDCIKILLMHGANVDFQTSEGTTALIRVAYNGYEECLLELCQYGASINIANQAGETALSSAISWGHHSIINILLAHGGLLPGDEYTLEEVCGLPSEIHHNCHSHKLVKHFVAIERASIRRSDDIKVVYRCSVCSRIGVNICYICRECKFYCHAKCVVL